MSWLLKWWRQFWFEPASPTDLGICRILFYGVLFLFYLGRDFSAWATVSSVFWVPVTLFRILHLPLLSVELLSVIQLVWKAALAFSCIGLFTRPCTAIAFILGVYLLGLPHCFGSASHNDAILVFVLGIMAFSRCGDSISVDAVRRSAKRGHGSLWQPAPQSSEYTWPIRAIWLVMALVFFAAGIAKLRRTGLDWILSDTLAIILIQGNYHFSSADPLTAWGLHLAQYSELCQLLAAWTIVIEVGFPLALVSRSVRWMVVPGTFLMQTGIRVLMGPSFEQFMFCYLFWIPWSCVLPLRSPNTREIMLPRPRWMRDWRGWSRRAT